MCLQEVLAKANEDSFSRIVDYAFKEHQSCFRKQKLAARQRIVPTALAISGSINPTDHAETFPTLMHMLQERVLRTFFSRALQ